MTDSLKVEAAERGTLKLLSIALTLAKRKMLIVSICTITVLLSIAYSLTLPNVYSATTKVLPPQKESVGLSGALGQMGGLAGLAAAGKGGDSDLYLSILKSRSVGEEVIKRLDLAKVYGTKTAAQTWRRLDQAVKANAGRDGIIAISAEDEDAKRAALMANTVADELGRTLVRLNLTKVGSEKLFLEKRLEVVKKALRAAEDDLKAFSQRNKIVQVEGQNNASMMNVTRLKNEIAGKEVQLAVLKNSQTEENYEAIALQAAINRLKAQLSQAVGSGVDGEGMPTMGRAPSLALEYARKLRELKVQESLFEQLTKQYEMAKLSQAKDASTLQILDEAVIPEEKVRPKRASIVLFAAVTSLVFSLALALVLEYLEGVPEEEKRLLMTIKSEVWRIGYTRGSAQNS
jgi:tyrosine-protein kinase Etk/Wzc